ncbi:MAG TPA: DUF4340 domain-containing protein [Polyangiaceae bacterium]|nr:DUF4340 domain-containing protein [Polyangiaceae bacterium]
MPTDKKLIIAIVVLLGLGGAVALQKKSQNADLAAHSLEGEAQKLPKVTFTDDDIKKIDKVELTRPLEKDGGTPESITLVKKGEEDWDEEKPVQSKGNASNVKSMLDALKRIEVKELIDPSKESYDKYKVSDAKALHAVFYKGKDVAFDAYFGEDGSRGQMTRLAGKDGVFAVKGYSSYLFNRDAKSWRDKTIFKFEEKDIVKVTLQNENGTFVFDKAGEDWKAKYGKGKGPAEKDIEKFDKSKLESLVRAYKALSAADFGDGKTPADTGLAEPKGTLTFEAAGGAAKYVVSFGGTAEGSNRWMKKNGSDEIWSISSWAGDWATANVDKFQKAEEKKPDEKKPDDKGKEKDKKAPEKK